MLGGHDQKKKKKRIVAGRNLRDHGLACAFISEATEADIVR